MIPPIGVQNWPHKNLGSGLQCSIPVRRIVTVKGGWEDKVRHGNRNSGRTDIFLVHIFTNAIVTIFAFLLHLLQPFHLFLPLLLLKEFHPIIILLQISFPLFFCELHDMRFLQRLEWWKLVIFILNFFIRI
ncbi:hypothetical protein OIU76_014415 [Salix suchowensis]|nr:hypothetical protein OIU76_014415 [Salix suchowensis]